jgi:hypothetical protein
VSLVEALAAAVAQRTKSEEVSAWQKATEVAEFQAYLKSCGKPHSTREIGTLLGLPQTRVAEQLTIATKLAESVLARYGVDPVSLTNAEHRGLLRIAKLPHYLREKLVRDAARNDVSQVSSMEGTKMVREKRRERLYSQLRDEGQLIIEIPDRIVTLSQSQARTYLDEFLPALAHLAEIVKGGNRSHYIGLAGNGGIVIYLSPP